MKKKNSNICRLFLTLLGLLMAIQICFGFAWMVVNLANVPIFGDSTEYFNLSQTLMVDEYRPLLYPNRDKSGKSSPACLPDTCLYRTDASLHTFCDFPVCTDWLPLISKFKKTKQ